jgi:hypothetical protein
MVETTNPKPAASFLNQLLDNKPSGSPQSAEVTSPARTITRVYPFGSQASYSNAQKGNGDG